MIRNSRRNLKVFFATYLAFAATGAAGQQVEEGTASTRHHMMGEKKGTSLIIHSNVKEASITVDGLLAGSVENAIDIEPGLVTLGITARNYTSRKIKINVAAGKQNEATINLTRLAMKNMSNQIPDYKTITFQKIDDLKHIYQVLFPKSEGMRPLAPRSCALRKDWTDEIFYAGISLPRSFPENTLTPQDQDLFMSLAKRLLDRRITETWLIEAETLFAHAPNYPPVYLLLSYGTMLSNNCQRSFQILREAQLAGQIRSELLTAQGLCLEKSGKLKEARLSLKGALTADSRVPENYYHLVRVKLAEGLQAQDRWHSVKDGIMPILRQCIQQHDQYFPCYELKRLVLLKGAENKKAKDVLREYMGKRWRHPKKVTRFALKLNREHHPLHARSLVAAALEEMPRSAELKFADAVLSLEVGQDVDNQAFEASLAKTNVTSSRLSLKILRKFSAYNRPELMIAGLNRVLKRDPKNSYVRWFLAKAYKTTGNHRKCIKTGIGIPTTYSTRVIRSLQKLMAECFVALKEIDKAIELYSSLLNEEPNNWKLHYNLAVVLERDAKIEKALDMYRKTLDLAPPEAVQEKVRQRLEMYSKRRLPSQ